jgi:hypothetical protein
MAGFFSDVDDAVNDTIGWDKLAAMVAMYFGMPTGGTGAESLAGGFEWLPSGEMTVADGASALGGSSGGTNFLSSIFGSSGTPAPLNPTDYSRTVQMYPTSSGNIFEPSGMSPTDIAGIQNAGNMSLLQDKLSARSMPNFGGQMQQQTAQQLAQLNQGGESGGMKKGSVIPQSILSSLLDPKSAVKAYRPTLI